MIWLAAALAAQPAPPASTYGVAPAVQARATVRILTGARLSFHKIGLFGAGGAQIRTAALRGSSENLRLYEFE